jgi:hypothetical protein
VRAHFTRPVTDQQGNLLPNVQVSIYDPGTTDPISDTIYSTDVGTNVLSNPYVSNTGIIDIYFDVPRRVRIGLIQGTLPVQYYEDVDVLAAGADSAHIGAGANSLVIGHLAVAPGDSATALGPGSSAGGAQGTAVGSAANALGSQSVAVGAAAVQDTGSIGIGDGAAAGGPNNIAIGADATTGMDQTIAIGHAAVANFNHSTAIGAGATNTGPNQIVLGTGDDYVELPPGSALALTSPIGNRFKITVDDDGSLTTTPA